MENENNFREVKTATTFDEQLEKLKARGCIIGDEVFAKRVLKQINYYRLTAYFLSFKKEEGKYVEGTTFNNVYRIYEFDRQLRNLLFSAVEEIELMLRTQLSYYHAHKYGSLGYENKNYYNGKHNHEEFIKNIEIDIVHNKTNLVVKHHQSQYGGKFPIWVIVELFTMGQLSFFYSDMLRADKKVVAKELFKTTDTNVESWLRCLTDLRNVCAHYSRLYNCNMVAIPATPKNFPYKLDRSVFGYIMVLKFLYFDAEKWNHIFLPNLEALIEEYSNTIDLRLIGFPEEWKLLLRLPNPTIEKTKNM